MPTNHLMLKCVIKCFIPLCWFVSSKVDLEDFLKRFVLKNQTLFSPQANWNGYELKQLLIVRVPVHDLLP